MLKFFLHQIHLSFNFTFFTFLEYTHLDRLFRYFFLFSDLNCPIIFMKSYIKMVEKMDPNLFSWLVTRSLNSESKITTEPLRAYYPLMLLWIVSGVGFSCLLSKQIIMLNFF